MPKSPNQKLKLFCILDMLKRKTDYNHCITMEEILEELQNKYQILAERKSIYDDISSLRDFGYDIIKVKRKVTGYTLAHRRFQLAELKLLVDAVQASKFITQKKSNSLIQKLASLTSKYEAKELEREIHVKNRIKTMNESIYYNVDDLHRAINNNRQISFLYKKWNINKELKVKKNGKKYLASPWKLIWDDENYYLIAYDEYKGGIKHYRVDKMTKIEMLDDERLGKSHFKFYNTAEYSKKIFGMFGGELEKVQIKFPNELIGPIIDRFGKDIIVSRTNNNYFNIKLDIVVSNQFFGWLTGLGPDIKIIKPASIARKYKNYLEALLTNYK